MHRARALFKEIIEDIEIVMKQYGPPPPIDHQNEEERLHAIAQLIA